MITDNFNSITNSVFNILNNAWISKYDISEEQIVFINNLINKDDEELRKLRVYYSDIGDKIIAKYVINNKKRHTEWLSKIESFILWIFIEKFNSNSFLLYLLVDHLNDNDFINFKYDISTNNSDSYLTSLSNTHKSWTILEVVF